MNQPSTQQETSISHFAEALKRLLTNEGGYANDPDDPGGETFKGVARNMFSQWEGWALIDSLKRQPGFPASLERNTELQGMIADFYRLHFWDRMQGDGLRDAQVAFSIFDFAVNAGVSTSVVLAQNVANVNADGVMGPASLQAINSMDPEYFLAAFTVAKILRYIAIVKKRPTSRKYFFGWVCRAVNH